VTTFTRITLDADALSLLTSAGLPVADLQDDVPRVFGGLYEDDTLIGIVGVELHLPSALLRSLAVVRSHQGRGATSCVINLSSWIEHAHPSARHPF